MYFSVGIEYPKSDQEAFGLIVPALCSEQFGCFSAADTEEAIAPMAAEAIQLVLESMQESNIPVASLRDLGALAYQQLDDYAHCDAWLLLYVDTTAFEGKPKRINISMPDTLISRIDHKVKSSPERYRDRSHFLATAARHELESTG